ncbi:hypothetical protein [Saccharothrix sp. NRRL B-16314]|uniref:hypothetical protein n=1 Tax=Saccharothrix sp. NRRL B-16314 TaxID=1463825 RepID=UPI0012DEDAD1|nr:hypothetical protein [Saccharothrix sp. NRRL B-16314]
MTSTSIRPSVTAGPRVGYLVGAVVDVVLLILVNASPGWPAVPFLTDDAVEVVVWVNVGLGLGVVVNTLCALFPRRPVTTVHRDAAGVLRRSGTFARVAQRPSTRR